MPEAMSDKEPVLLPIGKTAMDRRSYRRPVLQIALNRGLFPTERQKKESDTLRRVAPKPGIAIFAYLKNLIPPDQTPFLEL